MSNTADKDVPSLSDRGSPGPSKFLDLPEFPGSPVASESSDHSDALDTDALDTDESSDSYEDSDLDEDADLYEDSDSSESDGSESDGSALPTPAEAVKELLKYRDEADNSRFMTPLTFARIRLSLVQCARAALMPAEDSERKKMMKRVDKYIDLIDKDFMTALKSAKQAAELDILVATAARLYLGNGGTPKMLGEFMHGPEEASTPEEDEGQETAE
ncbi:hypothetical protein OQA88_9499 [Cercophora sp. LCS_1]